MPDYRPWYPHSQASANSSYFALLFHSNCSTQAYLASFGVFLAILLLQAIDLTGRRGGAGVSTLVSIRGVSFDKPHTAPTENSEKIA